MLPLQEGLVYGPVRSRRLGYSLGVNILPRHVKTCSLNCRYCQYGWTKEMVASGETVAAAWPSPSAVARAVALCLPRLLRGKDRLDHLTLAGNGEPSLHPAFGAVVRELRDVRDATAPTLTLAVLSNSTTLGAAGVVDALNLLDERYMKLDAGETVLLRRINAATLPVEQVLDGLKQLKDVVIQAMFVRDRLGQVDNATDLAIANWIEALLVVRPKAVHIYTLDRAPAYPYLQAVPADRLAEIARRARVAGLNAVAY
jgi:wyosine [tRNA(Phe)-imidazoG37] synthetase (radical SAM superfamily)